MSPDPSTFLPQFLPLGAVAKIVSTIVALMLAYAAITSELTGLKRDMANLDKRLQRIEDKLDRAIPPMFP